MPKPIPLKKWEKFWLLTALGEFKSKNWIAYEKCLCKCWNIKYISRPHLRKWVTNSCWCLRDEMSKKRIINMSTKHWMYWTRLYKIYTQAKYRCDNANSNWYSRYWWRWIKFVRNCFEEFRDDMYESYLEHLDKYWERQTTLDRIDNDWNYCKENCRWATHIEQQRNKIDNVECVYKWAKYWTIRELCEATNTTYHVVERRIKHWRDTESAIETPTRKRLHHK